MNYLDFMNLSNTDITKYQEGGSTPAVEFIKDITPGISTYRAYQRAKEDPRFGTYADLGLSAAGDVATVLGVGAAIKGLSAISKLNKARKATAAGLKTVSNLNKLRDYDNAQHALN